MKSLLHVPSTTLKQMLKHGNMHTLYFMASVSKPQQFSELYARDFDSLCCLTMGCERMIEAQLDA